MKLFLVILIKFFLVHIHLSNAGKYNISYEILDKCQEFDATNGYNYQEYFHLSTLKNLKPEDHEYIRLNLVILGQKDALILLSPTMEHTPDTPVYEIVLGAGANTFCEIRRKRKMNPLKTKRMEILNSIDPVPILIRIEKSGLIEVSVKGDGVMPVISVNDSEPIQNIQYISFSTWGSANVRFFFDCPNDEGQQLEGTKINDTKTRILHDILKNHDPFMIPHSVDEVMLANFTVKSIDFNEEKSILHTSLSVDLAWNDSSLVWEPAEYEMIKTIRHPTRFNFWRPSLLLLNGVEDSRFELNQIDYIFTLRYDGIVTAQSKDFTLQTFCGLDDTSNSRLNLKAQCAIQLSADGVSIAGYQGSLQVQTIAESKWSLIGISEDDHLLTDTDLQNSFEPVPHKMIVSYTLNLEKDDKRTRNILLSPIYTSLVILILSMVVEKFQRYSMISIVILIVISSLTQFKDGTDLAPFGVKMGFILVQLLFCCFVSLHLTLIHSWFNENPPKSIPHQFLVKIITFPWLRLSVGLARIGAYDYIQEKEFAWKEVSLMIDRIWLVALVIYGIVLSFTL